MHPIIFIFLILSFFVLVFGLAIFGGIAYPIWTIVYCANSDSRSKTFKTIWIIIMLLIWPLGSIAYGLFGSKRKLFQRISVELIIGLGLLLGIYFSMGGSLRNSVCPLSLKQARNQSNALSEKTPAQGTQTYYVLEGTPFTISKEGPVLDKKGQPINGIKKLYDKDKNLVWVTVWENGLQEGPQRSYYKTGMLKTEWTAVNGKESGVSKEYSENGKIVRESNWENGKLLTSKDYDESEKSVTSFSAKLSAQIVVSDKEFNNTTFLQDIRKEPIHEIVPGQKIFIAVTATGIDVGKDGMTDLSGDLALVKPDGSVVFDNKNIFEYKRPAEAKAKGGMGIFPQIKTLMFEQNDPQGVYVLRLTIRDHVSNQTATQEFKLTLKGTK